MKNGKEVGAECLKERKLIFVNEDVDKGSPSGKNNFFLLLICNCFLAP